MKDKIQATTKKKHQYCIHLTPLHYLFLLQLSEEQSNGDISKTLLYLISKHLKYLYKISNLQTKQTMTTTYQPKIKNYKKYYITLNPIYWAKLNHIKNYIGYSISAIIRILLDWEMFPNESNQEHLWIQKPSLNPRETIEPHSSCLIHSYVWRGWVDFNKRELIMYFYDYYQ